MKKAIVVLLSILVVVLGASGDIEETKKQPANLPSLTSPDLSKLSPYSVISVISGDSIIVNDGNEEIRVRLLGVDTAQNSVAEEAESADNYGNEAFIFASNLLKGEKVYLVDKTEQESTLPYKRVLSYVYRAPDGLFVNAEIIRQGYGRAYMRFDFSYTEQFKQLEQFARQANKGIWQIEKSQDKSITRTTSDALVAIRQARAERDAQRAAEAEEQAKRIAEEQSRADEEFEKINVYVTRTGKSYHLATCPYLRRSRGRIKMTLKETIQQGYTPCNRCNPPQ